MVHPFDELVFSGAVLDRQAHLRADPDALETLRRDPAARVLEAGGMAVAVERSGDGARLATRPVEPGDAGRDLALLGRLGPHLLLAALGGDGGTPLRQVADLLTPQEAGHAATAVALDNWHRTHPRCPRCGAQTELAQAGWVRHCPQDGSDHHPRTDPAVIMAVVDADDRLLLAQGAGWPQGRMSVLAGFVEPGETLAGAVAREVREEVGVDVVDVTYQADQPWPFPGSLMVGFTARATSAELTPDGTEIADARWFTRAELTDAFERGELRRPAPVSISARLIEQWFGGPLTRPSDIGAVRAL
ncbi:NAD(+) diphosphatase [Janibacter sp. Y6]|uniref:NAD(+) diphosphatase n=1 Tax=Janibacter sp. Y6 TaxID=2913552 RepID=UPI0034A0FAE5